MSETAKQRRPTVAELQALVPMTLEGRLRGLVALWRVQVETARQESRRAHEEHKGEPGPGWEEGFAQGRLQAYREAAEMLEAALDAGPKEHG